MANWARFASGTTFGGCWLLRSRLLLLPAFGGSRLESTWRGAMFHVEHPWSWLRFCSTLQPLHRLTLTPRQLKSLGLSWGSRLALGLQWRHFAVPANAARQLAASATNAESGGEHPQGQQ